MQYLIFFNTFSLFLLAFWAYLHIQKSVSTWERFAKIEKRITETEDECIRLRGAKLCSCKK